MAAMSVTLPPVTATVEAEASERLQRAQVAQRDCHLHRAGRAGPAAGYRGSHVQACCSRRLELACHPWKKSGELGQGEEGAGVGITLVVVACTHAHALSGGQVPLAKGPPDKQTV